MNRTADKKTYGLIVDYWGVSESLQEALAIFSPSDIKGAMEAKTDELPRLQARHAAAMRFFNKVKDRNDITVCAAVLEPEDVRAQFNQAFRRFAAGLVLPDRAGLPYVRDLKGSASSGARQQPPSATASSTCQTAQPRSASSSKGTTA